MRRFFGVATLLLTCFASLNLAAAEYEVQHLEDTDAQELIADGIVVVDFYADWCRPCVNFAPVFAEFAQEVEIEGAARAFKANVDEAKEFSRANNIRTIPTIICFKDGQEVDRCQGGQAEKLWEMVRQANELEEEDQ